MIMISALNTTQVNQANQMQRNFSYGSGAASGFAQLLNDILAAIAGGSIGIQSAAKDVDSLCLGGGAFSYDQSTSTGLTFGYDGGLVYLGNSVLPVSAGTIVLAASSTNYIETDRTGTIYTNNSAFTSGRLPLYVVVTGTSSISSVEQAKPLLVMLGAASITGQMLSAAANKRSIVQNLGSISATSSFIFTAPVAGTLSAATLIDAAAVATNGTNYWTITLTNKGAAGSGTTVMLDGGAENSTNTGGTSIAAYTPFGLQLTSTTGNLNFNAGDVLVLTLTATGSPTTLTSVEARLDYTFTG